MKVLVIGANGQVARHTLSKLKEEGHQVVAMIRDSSQADELVKLGADETVVADLEASFDHAFDHVDAVIFAAGSGGHTGADKTILIDLWGAIKAIDTAERMGVKRFVMLSSMGTVDPDKSDRIRHYLVAKKLADDHLKRSNLTYTIVRPGSLTNEQAEQVIKLEEEIQIRDNAIKREDVAIVLARVVNLENTFGKTFEILNGKTTINDALASI
ncbi:SDR family oxidoreductase [Halalkalibacter krulwichiae]|uniref:Putative sugar epimerase YhfK n=1 Tax=Halalkalibacter krulwichiae TaxID=199441 RepID=A0A1X9MD49_9BACI|nr:SDR family oxidoreductase [Halalkalibacter krulwichiae]ARK29481.1 putative sugar epimerase YhfK [Halalkalibacter krulwichiae]